MATNLLNDTKFQHFVSQAEQRLNTSTPDAARKNQRIYRFEMQRVGDETRLGEPQHARIHSNLALDDVFSFDVKQNSTLRENFEALFHRYEDSVQEHTEAVLQKAAANDNDGMNVEVFEVFKAKLMNFLRNPFAVAKMLDTFRNVSTLVPTNPERRAELDRVLNGNKPHEEQLCKTLGLTPEQYRLWLGTQFMLLSDVAPGQDSLFDQILESLFTNPQIVVLVWIGKYTTEKCLLSDRGFSNSINVPYVDSIDFNLRHDAFIRYVFRPRRMVLQRVPAHMIDAMPKLFNVYYSVDDMDHLRTYNWNVMNQSRSHVFCASGTGVVH